MTTASIHYTKTHLSRLLELVISGEEIIIERFKKPIAKISAISPPKLKKRVAGRGKKYFKNISSDILDNSNEEISDIFYNSSL